MRCCCCNGIFHPVWDTIRKDFTKDCPKCVDSYTSTPKATEEMDDETQAILDKLENEMGIQNDNNTTITDLVRVERGINGDKSVDGDELESDEINGDGCPPW
jgi:hypothetical protein